MLDQGLNSAQNFALLIIVARGSDPREFGAFSVAIAAAMLIVGLGKSVFGQASLILLGSRSTDARDLAGVVLFLATVLGLGSSLVLLGLSEIITGDVSVFLLLLALTIVPLVLQDVARYLLIGKGNATGAILADAAWTIAWLGLVIGASAHEPSAADHFLFWASTSSFGALAGMALLRPRISLHAIRAESRKMMQFSRPLFFEWVCVNASVQSVVFALAAILGLAATGGLRAAQSIFGPVNTLLNAVEIVFVAEFAALTSRRGIAACKVLAVRVGASCTLIATVVAATALLLPDGIGTWLYGETWYLTTPVLIPIALQRIFGAAAIGASSYLRGSGSVRKAVKGNTIGVTTELVLALSLAPAGIMASAFGLMTGTIVKGVLQWRNAIPTFPRRTGSPGPRHRKKSVRRQRELTREADVPHTSPQIHRSQIDA
jgi:O-antigen/teichoic acid export membrane protein